MLKDLNEISDGKVYGPNDMARLACHDCRGCCECCRGMGDSVVLDPADIWRLCTGTGKDFEELVRGELELGMAEGMILPHIRMTGPGDGCCAFLDAEGRCSIHALRPGLCRLFPLGRIYEETGIRYFLQKDACRIADRTKIKVIKWLDTPDWKKNEAYLLEWHRFRSRIGRQLAQTEDEQTVKTIHLFVLSCFFFTPYQPGDFYGQFAKRMERAEEVLPFLRETCRTAGAGMDPSAG